MCWVLRGVCVSVGDMDVKMCACEPVLGFIEHSCRDK